MKFLKPLTLILLLSQPVAKAENQSTPKTSDPKTEEQPLEDGAAKDQDAAKETKIATGNAEQADKVAVPTELAPLPFGAVYSFGVARKKEGSMDLHSAGFARLEFFKSMVKSGGFFNKMTVGLSYSAADIGGTTENKGGYKGTLTSFGLNLSGFSAKRGHWKSKTGASLEINKLKRLPSFKYGNSGVEVAYKPSVSLSQTAYYALNQGLSIGPAIAVQMGGISGWTFGFEALFAF